MADQLTDIASSILQSAAALTPALAVLDPKAAAIMEMANIAVPAIQIMVKAHEAELASTEQVVALFASINARIQSTHNKWAAMNAADAAAGVTA